RLSIDDFSRIGRRVPVLADLKPSGKYGGAHLVRIGGLPPLMRMLLDRGLIHGDCQTVTGRSVAENLRDVGPYPADQDVIRPFSNPIKADSHLRILYGNLAPQGAVAKISGKEGLRFSGKAIVFESEESALAAILGGRVRAGHVIVIRNEGPVGGPGMREMLAPTSAVVGKGLGSSVGLITDGRFSGGSPGFVVGHLPRGGRRRADRRRQERRPDHDRRRREHDHARRRGRGGQGAPQGAPAVQAQGDPRGARQVRAARDQRLAGRRHRQGPFPMNWNRFKALRYQDPALGVALDISRIPFPDGYLASMEGRMQKAFADMAALEKGALANPSEKRMVGHYWLRAPQLAPTPEIMRAIEPTLASGKDFASAVPAGAVAAPKGRFTRLLVVGIGGSALGPQFVSHALGAPGRDRMAVHFFDNTDPDGMDYVLGQIGGELGRTLVVVISKSGGTLETRNGQLEAAAAFKAAGLSHPAH